MFDVSFRYLKISRSYFLFLSHLIRIYKRNHDRCKTLLNYRTLREPLQYLFIIPSSLISLSLIRTAAGWDVEFFSYFAFVFLNLKFL